MKDYLGQHRWVNLFPKNPTQTRYLRFLQTPQGELKSSFTDSMLYFEKSMEKYKTVYEKSIGDL